MELVFPFDSLPDPSIVALLYPSNDPSHPSRPGNEKKYISSNEKKTGNRVLIVGRLRELAIYRAEFLRQAGFDVMTAADADDAVRIIQHGSFDAIILSYTLSRQTVQYLANATRDYCPDCAVVAIAETRIEPHLDADAVAIADEGPTALVATLKRVLRQD